MSAIPLPHIWIPDRRIIVRRPNVATTWRDRLRRFRDWVAPTKVDAQGRFVQAGGRVVAAGGQKAGDSANCGVCPCTSAGDCAPCDALGHPTPNKWLLTFSGMSLAAICTCFSDQANHPVDAYTFSGDLNGATFCLDRTSDCTWQYDGPGPITASQYSYTTFPLFGCDTFIQSFNRIIISFGLGGGGTLVRAYMPDVLALESVNGFFYDSESYGSSFDCSASFTKNNNGNPDSTGCGGGTGGCAVGCYTFGGSVTGTPTSSC